LSAAAIELRRAAIVTRLSRPYLYLLLAAALFIRAFLPQGYMPERSSSGTIAVALCASGGVHLIRLGETEPRNERRAEQPCMFAGTAAPLLPPPAPLVLESREAGEAVFASHIAAPGLFAGPRLLPPATGPPLPA